MSLLLFPTNSGLKKYNLIFSCLAVVLSAYANTWLSFFIITSPIPICWDNSCPFTAA